MDVHTEEILEGMKKIDAIAALVESTLTWRAAHIAWDLGLYPAENLLKRLIFEEGCKNPQAMDLLARIYFQQQRYDRAKKLWEEAVALQPGNPFLKRSLAKCQDFAQNPGRKLLVYRIQWAMRSLLCLFVVCGVLWGGARGVLSLQRWMQGSETVQRLAGRFHYDYDSQTKYFKMFDDMGVSDELGLREEFSPDPTLQGRTLGATMSFTRKKALNGQTLGRIEVIVERKGNTAKAIGRVPSLYVRYLVEGELFALPGVQHVDLRGLEVDRSYRVRRGDSLWIISRRMFGSGADWSVLARYNNLDNPNALRVGQNLALPLGNERLVPDK